MTFEEYQKKSKETAVYPNQGDNLIYPVLGLLGESGEIAEKVKKVIRDSNGVFDEKAKIEILKEVGDVLWYLSQIATELEASLEEIAASNIEKTFSRKQRGKLHGEGDNR